MDCRECRLYMYVLSRHWMDCQECGLFGTVLTSICTIRTIHGLTGGWTVQNMNWPVYCMYYQDNTWIAGSEDCTVYVLTMHGLPGVWNLRFIYWPVYCTVCTIQDNTGLPEQIMPEYSIGTITQTVRWGGLARVGYSQPGTVWLAGQPVAAMSGFAMQNKKAVRQLNRNSFHRRIKMWKRPQ